jgi:hypothetical protein
MAIVKFTAEHNVYQFLHDNMGPLYMFSPSLLIIDRLMHPYCSLVSTINLGFCSDLHNVCHLIIPVFTYLYLYIDFKGADSYFGIKQFHPWVIIRPLRIQPWSNFLTFYSDTELYYYKHETRVYGPYWSPETSYNILKTMLRSEKWLCLIFRPLDGEQN